MKNNMIPVDDFIFDFYSIFNIKDADEPWKIIGNIEIIISDCIELLEKDFIIENDIAIHKSAIIHSSSIIHSPAIISENTFIGPYSILRGGIYLGNGSKIGHGCEIKSTIIMAKSNAAHLNYIGDSIIGNDVNIEAGAVVANFLNEKAGEKITFNYNGKIIESGVSKFGALVGDHTRIGANAVLSPGTILNKKSIVNRLELIKQI